jgi:hypothetical protein
MTPVVPATREMQKGRWSCALAWSISIGRREALFQVPRSKFNVEEFSGKK